MFQQKWAEGRKREWRAFRSSSSSGDFRLQPLFFVTTPILLKIYLFLFHICVVLQRPYSTKSLLVRLPYCLVWKWGVFILVPQWLYCCKFVTFVFGVEYNRDQFFVRLLVVEDGFLLCFFFCSVKGKEDFFFEMWKGMLTGRIAYG